MKKKGIYLVQPQHNELKIIYNQKDAERAGDPRSPGRPGGPGDRVG